MLYEHIPWEVIIGVIDNWPSCILWALLILLFLVLVTEKKNK